RSSLTLDRHICLGRGSEVLCDQPCLRDDEQGKNKSDRERPSPRADVSHRVTSPLPPLIEMGHGKNLTRFQKTCKQNPLSHLLTRQTELPSFAIVYSS